MHYLYEVYLSYTIQGHHNTSRTFYFRLVYRKYVCDVYDKHKFGEEIFEGSDFTQYWGVSWWLVLLSMARSGSLSKVPVIPYENLAKNWEFGTWPGRIPGADLLIVTRGNTLKQINLFYCFHNDMAASNLCDKHKKQRKKCIQDIL